MNQFVAWQSCLVVWQAHVFGGCIALPMSALALGLQPCAVNASAHSHCGVADLCVGGSLCTELKDHICESSLDEREIS